MNEINQRVLIVGGGIAGLAQALTLHQLGIECCVFELAEEPRALGVGINLQPNAVRELYELGITSDELDAIGLQAQEWALVGLNGNDIYAESRGLSAGYHWPQYAVHRGELLMLLYRKVRERLGPQAINLGHRALSYSQTRPDHVEAHFELRSTGERVTAAGTVLIAADGIHSTLRAQMHPKQPPIQWGGTIMWRGVTRAKAVRTGSTFLGLGSEDRRLIIYPISQPDKDGISDINWIAEIRVDDYQRHSESWFSEVPIDSFLHHFSDMSYDWLDVPSMLSAAPAGFENPMIDRDPVSTWQDDRVLLIGDAAHPMYPTGSNGASQAIIDARQLGALFREHGVNKEALRAFDERFNGPINELVLRNRGDGPFGLLEMVESRCGGIFDNIDDVIPADERSAFMARYQQAAGFARDTLNASPPILPMEG